MIVARAVGTVFILLLTTHAVKSCGETVSTQSQTVARAEDRAFKSIDRDGDGVLTGMEAEVMIPFDSNNDQKVTKEEFRAALGSVRSRGIRDKEETSASETIEAPSTSSSAVLTTDTATSPSL